MTVSPEGGARPDQLERIQAVTDISLAHLALDDLLAELLDRVVDVLEADTAAVLLVDASGRELVARAARGIDEEVRQGVRVPIGAGFAGRIAAERRPITLEGVGPENVANPILWQKGIKSVLGAPLMADGALVGVIHVGSLGDKHFEHEDVEVLELAADRIANAVRLRLLETERDAATVLQRSLLPSTPADLGDLEFAARYVPSGAGGVGGDWYDVFRLDDGSTWIMVGDVAGHGFRAAVVMGRARSAMRSYALLDLPPDEVLALTDRKFLHFEVGQMATVALVVVSPDGDRAQVVLAGHPPPLLTGPDCSTMLLDARPGPPLGVVDRASRPVTTIDLDPGTGLFLYTDGLVERRGEPLDIGLERLRQAVPSGSPAAMCQHAMAQLVGDRTSEDDIAVLAVRRRPTAA